MSQIRRRIFLIDSKVQGALVFRVGAYWLYCLFTISMLLVWWDLFTGPSRTFLTVASEVYRRFAPAAAASLCILPLVVMDLLRMSNRFVGPARRLQTALRALGEGRQVMPVIFRDNDFWQELAADFNRVNDRVKRLTARQSPIPSDSQTSHRDVADEAQVADDAA
jgi:hypothetical protein